MYDYNYFESYTSRKKGKAGSNGKIVLVFVLFFLAVGCITGYTYYKKTDLLKEIHVLEKQLETEDNKAVIQSIQDKQALLVQVQQIKNDITNAPIALDEVNNINKELIEAIVNALPSDAQIIDITFDEQTINMNGKAALRSAVAEFEHNLRLALVIPEIKVRTISFDENEYTFDLEIAYGGDENESIK